MSSVKPGQDVDIDLARLFRAIWEKRVRVGVVTAVVVAASFGVAKMLPPEYQAETQVLIELRSPDFSDKTRQASQNSDPVLDSLGIASQVQVFKSADLIRRVARKLKLYDLSEFDPAANPSFLKRLLVTFGLMKNPLDVPPEDRVLKAFREKLEVYQVNSSRVIGIQFTSENPALAAQIPNEMANVYLSMQSGDKLDTDSEAARWLEPEIATLREKVKAAETKIANYRASNGLLKTGADQTFADQQLNDSSAELAKVRADLASANARAEAVRNALKTGSAVDTISDVMSSPTIQRLKEQESNIQGQISDLSITLLDNHPRLKGLRAQLAGIRQQIKAETRKILSSLENEAHVAQLRERQLVAQLNTLKADSAQADEKQVGLNALEREAKAERDLLETYLARYREAASRAGKGSALADARVISNAVEPTNIHFPKVLPIMIVAALASILINSVVIMLNELFSGRAWKEVEPSNGARSEPVVSERRESQDSMHPRTVVSLLSAAEEDVARAVSRQAKDANPDTEDDFSIASVARHVVASERKLTVCVSPTGDEGSAATVELARRIADMGLRTVLLDMSGSTLPTREMTENAGLPGITDILSGTATIASAIHGDRASNAHIIPFGVSDAARAMRGADRLTMIIGALSEAYDKVLVECGPVDGNGAERLMRNADGEIILSLPKPTEEQLVSLIPQFQHIGDGDVVLMAEEALSGGGDGASHVA